MENKKILRSTIIGFVLWLISAVTTGVVGVVDSICTGGTGVLNGRSFYYGLRSSIGYYLEMWDSSAFNHPTGYIGVVLVFAAIIIGITAVVISIIKKKPVLIFTAIVEIVALGFLPFVFIFIVPMVQMGVATKAAVLLMGAATAFNLCALCFLIAPIIATAKCEKECCCGEGLSKKEVSKIVKEAISEHVNEYHQEEEPVAPAPIKEEEPEPEPEEDEPEEIPVEEPVPEESIEDEDDEEEAEEEGDEVGPDGLVIKGKKRRASFETRLRNSEYDIRHKYYDLRDYIKWYGMRNRISIPGDTFSYKRQRYAFVTIVGKHLRIYLALNPKDYADSTIPVEAVDAKKYEDLPCLLRIKSDLAYRRAKKLVDDLMQKVGLERPEGEEPKETQNQD